MKEYACPKAQFLSDVSEHGLTVLRDNGVERHLRFRKPGAICYGFDLITWTDHLLITGDCGSFLFRRLEDMFQFFRTDRQPKDELHINPQYWSEKLLATDCNGANGGAAKKFSSEMFEASIKRWFDDHFEGEIREDAEPDEESGFHDSASIAVRKAKRDEIWAQIESSILRFVDSEHEALKAAMDFEHQSFRFQDFYEVDNRDYSFHFIWCAYAIAWGIRKYDEAKVAASALAAEVPA